MTIAAEFIALAERVSARFRAPRIRALLLPPGGPRASKDAEFCALELDDGSVGFSYLLLGDTFRRLQERGVDELVGIEAVALAREYASQEPVARTLGFAAINALSQQLFKHAGWLPPEAADSLGEIRPAPGEHIGMVGLFGRLVAPVLEAGARLTVLELREDLAGSRDGYRVTVDPADLAGCEKVVATSTMLLNDTLASVLDACRGARYFAIVGPTAGCLPDPLFARGVAVVGGTRVIDLHDFREAFLADAPWSRYAAKYAIPRAAYPGSEELLRRASSG